MYGVAHEELTFFGMILTGTYIPKHDSGRLGKISVSGGSLSIPQLVSYLQYIVPDDQFQWDVRHIEDNVFQVTFPSKTELARMLRFGELKVPDSPCSISFDTWSSKAEPFCKLPEVWLRVEGIPEHTIGDFLALWGLGTLFGKTLDVDMPYTRRHKVLRILIGCLDYTLIQERLDVFIKDGMYKLNFTVEAPKANQVVEDEIMGDADEDGEDKGEKGKEAQKEDGDNSNKPAAEKRKENEDRKSVV